MVPLVKIRLVKLGASERSTLGPTNIFIFQKTSLKENWKLMIDNLKKTFDHIACVTLTGS